MPGKPRSKKLCVVTNSIAATCQTCGKVHPSPLHMPERHRGWYCGACCPQCSPQTHQPNNPGTAKVAGQKETTRVSTIR